MENKRYIVIRFNQTHQIFPSVPHERSMSIEEAEATKKYWESRGYTAMIASIPSTFEV